MYKLEFESRVSSGSNRKEQEVGGMRCHCEKWRAREDYKMKERRQSRRKSGGPDVGLCSSPYTTAAAAAGSC